MTRAQPSDAPPAMQRVVPALRITDPGRSRAFYADGLGFTVDWEHRFEPGFPVFMQITRDGLSLYLSQHAGDALPGANVHLYVDDVDAWYDDARRRGLAIDSPPEDRPWGNRDFRVRDPDGNTLVICTRRSPPR